MLGIATLVISPKILKSKAFACPSCATFLSLISTHINASIPLAPWHINVAHATLATPISKHLTNNMSAPILLRDDTARNINGVTESPRAEKIPVAILYISKNTKPPI